MNVITRRLSPTASVTGRSPSGSRRIAALPQAASRVHPDPQAQRQDRRCEKPWLVQQDSGAIAKVHEEVAEPHDVPDVAARFALTKRGAKGSPRFLRVTALRNRFRDM